MSATPRPLCVVMIAPLRFPIRLPFAGGLESAVWNEVRLLRARGHHVDFVATEGSDFLDGPDEFVLPAVDWQDDPRAADDTYPPGYLRRALPALGRALDRIAVHADDYDVVVNHCLHGLPLRRAGSLGLPMISTLHTPVVADLVESHAQGDEPRSRFLSVSRHTEATWSRAGIRSEVLQNGVDHTAWIEGPGGDSLVWFGRIVREKAPHLALDTARLLDRPLTLAGRIGDRAYFEAEILPRLDVKRRFAGPSRTSALVDLVGRSACALVTPLWDEPFGLVTPEALLCGTPVAAFDVGGISELAKSSFGLATGPIGDVLSLATAVEALIGETSQDPGRRHEIRLDAVRRFSLDSRIERLEEILRSTGSPGLEGAA